MDRFEGRMLRIVTAPIRVSRAPTTLADLPKPAGVNHCERTKPQFLDADIHRSDPIYV
jgi:hypothetical protein